jgi:hypothetical protein
MGFDAVLKKAFPFISAAASLGGPLGTMAANAVGSAIGVDKVEASADGIASAVTSAQTKDPEALLKLQQVEADFKVQMAKLGFEDAEKLAEMEFSDREGARQREISVRDNTPKILAFVVVALTAGAEGYLLLHGMVNIDPSWAVVLGRILGTLDSALITVLAYYFGSSSGSAAKTDIMAKQQQGK